MGDFLSFFKIYPFDKATEDIKGKGFHYKGRDYIHHSLLHHTETAFRRFSFGQIVTLCFIIAVVGLGLYGNWHNTIIALISILTTLYAIDLLFNFFLIYKSFRHNPEIHIPSEALQNISAVQLPMYTILCPLYKEAHILPQFITAINNLSYPKEKLDVMLLFEEDDIATIEEVKLLNLPSYFRIVIVPHSLPKTKPKACNYGLKHAKGEYVVIYDAEDIPDSLQLKKAYAAFQRLPEDVVCIQAKLNFYNPHQNLLTRIFTAEYSLWFDLVLTGLQSIHAPIPLGGTSNHFKVSKLKDVKGWDSFNVTEDCDLGIRLVKMGYTTALIDSVTLEEANSKPLNWFWQRTRWIKGYIQTYFVHMRQPLSFFTSGSKSTLFIFQLVVGGKILSTLLNPLFWLLTMIYFLFRAHVGVFIESFFPLPILYLGVFSFVAGNFLYMYYYMMGCVKNGNFAIVRYVFVVPIYWLFMSIAGYVAVLNFLFRPHHWFKTKHGLHLPKHSLHMSFMRTIIEKIRQPFRSYTFTGALSIATMLSVFMLLYYFSAGQILAYGDAESHINIAKRVISGLTPGFGQLGGVWLPLQHIMMLPFVLNDSWWRSGIGGSVVSMLGYIAASLFIYKIIYLLTKNTLASLVGFLVFALNPNILYLQATPLGEVSLIVMLVAATYFLLKWAIEDNILDLIFGAFFIFLGSLIRYDAWFFAICSIGVIPLVAIFKKYSFPKLESAMILYSCVAFLGMIFWLGWNYLIFKNPVYFLASPYSAKAQQLVWLKQGQLPSYHHIVSSVVFYTTAAKENVGGIILALGVLGLTLYFLSSLARRNVTQIKSFLILLLIASPYLFYVVTLFAGISIIFIPNLVPKTFLSSLFNIRYGIMVLPALSLGVGLLWNLLPKLLLLPLTGLLLFQATLFAHQGVPIILQDGTQGLSARRPPPVNEYVARHYDGGYIMFDDYSRTANPVSLDIPMNKIIYVGNHPYWEDALAHPKKYLSWVIIRHDENDALWSHFHYNKEFTQNYHVVYGFEKTYVYKKNDVKKIANRNP